MGVHRSRHSRGAFGLEMELPQTTLPVKRFFIDAAKFDATGQMLQVGPTLAPMPFDAGWKDTILVPPGDGVTTYQVTVVRQQFLRKGAYPYHCHIIDHEDNDMMRWFQVV